MKILLNFKYFILFICFLHLANGYTQTTIDLGPDTTYCIGQCFTLDIDSIYSDTSEYSYIWRLDGVYYPEYIYSDTIIVCPDKTTYSVSVDIISGTSESEGEEIMAEIVFTLIFPPSDLLFSDSGICLDSCIKLFGPSGGNNYEWEFSVNDTSNITIADPIFCGDTVGTYFAIVNTSYGNQDQCTQQDTFTISVHTCSDSGKQNDSISSYFNLTDNVSDVLNLYPNPAKSLIYLDFNTVNEKKLYLSIYDMLGHLIRTEEIYMISPVVVDLHGFSAGDYVVKCFSDDQYYTKKFLTE